MTWTPLALRGVGQGGTTTRAALVRFALCTLAAVLLVGTGTALISSRIADDEAVRDARARTVGIARGIAAPLVDDGVRRGDPESMAALGAALRNRMRDGSIAHVVLYDLQGVILWSDEPELVGTRDPLRPEVLRAIARDGSVVTNTEDHPRHRHPSEGHGRLVEVYVGVTDADGEPFVFEAYTPRAQLQADAGAIFESLLPLTVGSLLLLVVLILPFALSMARRIDRANAQRATILRRSLQAWHHERARIAQLLHDDVIQDLSALSYALPGVLQALPQNSDGESARGTGQQLNGLMVASLRTLRGLLADLVPTGLDGAGLVATLEALAQRTRDAGLPVRLVVEPDIAPTPAVGGLVYRAVREGLLNVQRHAGASEALVTVHRLDSSIEIVVADDGRGPATDRPPGDEHVGLRLLSRLLQEVGGTAELAPRPSGGAMLRVLIPSELPDLEGDTRG